MDGKIDKNINRGRIRTIDIKYQRDDIEKMRSNLFFVWTQS